MKPPNSAGQDPPEGFYDPSADYQAGVVEQHRPVPVARSRLILDLIRRLILATTALLIFVLALDLLKRGASAYGQSLIALLSVDSPASALGFGWLLAYIFLSGSPVAAVAVSFFASGTIDAVQTFMMITGSRLGASFIVLLVGFVYYLRGYQRTASLPIGVLALLTTAAIYLPALPVGYLMLTLGTLNGLQLEPMSPLASILDLVIEPVVGLTTAWLPSWTLLILGAALLMLTFSLFDRALPELSADRMMVQQFGRLIYRPMAMFVLGAAVTSITLSVSVSLSVLVPLSAKGLVRREHTLPYIMGANITTFIDTLVAALIVGGPAAFTIVVVEMTSVAFLSLIVLLFAYRGFSRGILRLQAMITRSRYSMVLFLGIMLLVPLLLLVGL